MLWLFIFICILIDKNAGIFLKSYFKMVLDKILI